MAETVEKLTTGEPHAPPEAMLADAYSPAVRSLKQILLGR
jgi:hypothetical protein